MSDSSCWDWLLMAAAKWELAGRQMEAGGAANGSQRGGTWRKPCVKAWEVGIDGVVMAFGRY